MDILFLFSSAIVKQAFSISTGWGGGGVSIIKSWCYIWQLQKEGFQHLSSSLSLAIQLLLWTNISNRFQMVSVMLNVSFKFVKTCPIYQTSSVSHMLFIARSIWLHGIVWNKHPGVSAPRAISALFLCVAVGALVQASLMYQWMHPQELYVAGRSIPALDYKTDWSRMPKTSRHFLHSAFIENAQNKKTWSWNMKQGEGKTLYLVSSFFILFAYKQSSSHLNRKEHWQVEETKPATGRRCVWQCLGYGEQTLHPSSVVVILSLNRWSGKTVNQLHGNKLHIHITEQE